MSFESLDQDIGELVGLHHEGVELSKLWGRQFDLGLAFPSLDSTCGGRGLDGQSASDADRRLREAGLPHPRSVNMVGVSMAAPFIARNGTDEQRDRHLRSIFTGEQIWCQLFSEPGAGSDLANVATNATRDGDEWRISGQKVWNSFALEASYALLLTRFDPMLPKHRGMAFFLLDMTTPGIDARPLRMMTGDAEFAEVFLDDVVVPDRNRVGDPGAGWAMALDVLMSERVAVGSIGEGSAGTRPFDRIKEQATPTWDPVTRDRLAGLVTQDQVQRLTNRRAAASAEKGTPGPEGAVLRILTAEHHMNLHEFGIDSRGPGGMLVDQPYPTGDDIAPPDHWDLPREFLFSPGLLIGGGTLEINRNIVGERVLGLPPEPRVDKQQPWRDQHQ